MNTSYAKIIVSNTRGLYATASAAKISTQPGEAIEIFKSTKDKMPAQKLIKKVLASGHKSVIEHQTLTVAFNNVSVMVEQFMIEFRLASFTVKSRRYVNFKDAGYVIPKDQLTDKELKEYTDEMDSLFKAYGTLVEMGIPVEDARFVLPYCFRSNFYVTTNAREMIHIICTMIYGRGQHYPEIAQLGYQLKKQFDKLYPGIIEDEQKNYTMTPPAAFKINVESGVPKAPSVSLRDPYDSYGEYTPISILTQGLMASGWLAAHGYHPSTTAEHIKEIIQSARPRELELLNYTFMIDNVSLPCLTHLTRHRIQSPIIPDVITVLSEGNYIMPPSIEANPAAKAIYEQVFANHAQAIMRAEASGVSRNAMVYYVLSGYMINIILHMNARELLLFMKLRTCSRAQWDIRGIARQMLEQLSLGSSGDIFKNYGPSCAITGQCPEGKMSCGHPVRIEKGQWIKQ